MRSPSFTVFGYLMQYSRSVGGVRVSLYNGVTKSNVQVLVDYIMEFVELVAM